MVLSWLFTQKAIRKYTEILFLWLWIFFCPQITYAKGTDFQFDRSKPIEVTADSLVVTDDKKTGEFIGNVQVTQNNYKLTANRIVIQYTDDKNQSDLVQTITAYENVYLFTDNQQAAKAQSLIYNLKSIILTLSGDVLLSYDNNILKGNQITMNTQTRYIKVIGSPKQRVKALLKLPE